MDSIAVLLSALLGLLLMDGAILLGAGAYKSSCASKMPLEVRYVALLVVFFLVVLNGNQWVAGTTLFPSITVATIAIIAVSARRISINDRGEVLADILSLVLVQATVLGLTYLFFSMHRYWLLEGPNHDSIVYYQGLEWASNTKLLVGKEAVNARWGLGSCLDGAGWIGFDCPLYRGGTYTIAAWVQFFSPRTTGNGIYFLVAYVATMAWFGVRASTSSTKSRKLQIITNALISIICTISTGVIGAVVNANMATALAGSLFFILTAISINSEIAANIRYTVMAAICAIGAHLYGESLFYLLCFVFSVVIVESFRINTRLDLMKLCRIFFMVVIVILILGNVTVFQAVASLISISGFSKNTPWFSWYISHNPMVWIGGYVTGILMGGAEVRLIRVIAGGVVVLLTTFYMASWRETRSTVLGLIALSVIFVLYVETTQYQYGEHKVLQLIGPAWTFMAAVAAYRIYVERRDLLNKIAAGYLIAGLVYVSISFISDGKNLLESSKTVHGMKFGLDSVVSNIRPGDKVLLDDSAWSGVSKFQKTHYLIYKVHDRGGDVLMPDLSGDPLRGGYFRKVRNNSFEKRDRVDWIVSGVDTKFIADNSQPVFINNDYRLSQLKKNGAAVPGNGWYDCEQLHCWTKANPELEAYSPPGGDFFLELEFLVFNPPKDGTIKIVDQNGTVQARVPANQTKLRIKLRQGWSRFKIEGDWHLNTPKILGLSEDSRALFLAVSRIEVVQ